MAIAATIKDRQLVFTIKERCKVCYTCVRECPCKAIRIVGGQAEVMAERCIGCGNCVNVCRQNAKVFLDTKNNVYELLKNHTMVAACIAPSFPAEFSEFDDYGILISMIRQLGFALVTEVAFGADLVANEYKRIFQSPDTPPVITANCPAVVAYIERYQPNLVERIGKIVSPMVAMARVMKKHYGDDIKAVFIGPCISKKAESSELDEVLTFRELRDMFKEKNIRSEDQLPSEFDPPLGGRGAIFPVSRGMLQTIKMPENLFDGNVIVADGTPNFQDALREFDLGHLKSQHLELMACNGCIMGPGMTMNGKRFARRTAVSNYVVDKLAKIDKAKVVENLKTFKTLDFTRAFTIRDQRQDTPPADKIVEILEKMGKSSASDYLDCGTCGYSTCWNHAVAISKGLAEIEMCLPYTIEKLHKYNDQLKETNEKLASMQKVLKQKEKLAGMGQLSAGIAHELNNPLGVVIMYSNLLLDECPEGSEMKKDLELIVEQANRCKRIVSGLLSFSRKEQFVKSYVNAAKLLEKSIHAVVVPANVRIKKEISLFDPNLMVDEEQMVQVISNLLKNAVEAMPKGGLIQINVSEKFNDVYITIRDSGTGIPREYMDKIFDPFFTTKEIGKGTGLGLAITYGIIKMHRGRINVSSNTDPLKGPTGTEFEIVMPKLINI